ncbi:MAG TPA: ATP-binding protein [Candidatus Enterosoma merdigallinarum]|nr:ATP-binding protein [Candidatus Enterosoma merdigallinarum]
MIYRTEYMQRLKAFKDNKIIKVVTGLRRSGKSTLLEMFRDELLQSGVQPEQIQYINFELMKYDAVRNYKQLYNVVTEKALPDKKNYLFFDEIQQVSGWEKTVNSLSLEYDADIYVTGSNAYLLSSELATLISGRYVEIKMLPLSFKEYYGYYRDSGKSREELFNNYLKYGGLPQLLSLPQDEQTIGTFLSSIYDTVILKDVLGRNKLRDIDLLKRVYAFVCGNVGSITSTNSMAKYIANEAKLDTNVRPATIGNILEMLENAFIIYRADRYDVKGKEVLKSLEKYYLADTGLKNIIVGYNLENYGHSIENVVYLELLRRGYRVYVGKNAAKEIDFVAINKEETRYFQVTESLADKATQEREIAPFRSTHDFYEKTIITTDKTYITNVNGIKIVNLIDFLLS